MLKKLLKGFVSFTIVLHCIGITQFVSSYAGDKSVFTGMLNMNEEETKKEKESKEDADSSKDFRSKNSCLITDSSFIGKHIYFSFSKSRTNHQFIIELPTPPPDFKA